MLRIEFIYLIAGLLFAAAAWRKWRSNASRRVLGALFWSIIAIAFFAGDSIESALKVGIVWPAQAMGGGVILLAAIAGSGSLRRSTATDDDAGASEQRIERAKILGNRLFVPALLIPLLTLLLVLFGQQLRWGDWALFDARQFTLLALGIACLIALAIGLRLTRSPASAALTEGTRLLDLLGWAAVLPMVLASLGGVFIAAGVGDNIAALVAFIVPVDVRLACVLAYALGMVFFTLVMGNAFAAFPVMTAGIGLPLLVLQHHANPAIVGALGMLCGYCGTLLTPMAANYNVVPAVLLELKDRNGVIRAQVPTALSLLLVNIILMYLLAFR